MNPIAAKLINPALIKRAGLLDGIGRAASYIKKLAQDAVNPIQQTESSLLEPGMPNSFGPTDNTYQTALTNGVIGLGAGIAGGAIADKNKWYTGLNTGAGSSAGYLIAKLLAHKAAPGQQDVYGTVGSLIGGGIGLGSSLMQQQIKKKKQMELSLPQHLGLNIKVSSIKDLVNNTVGQLPNIRGFDSMVGGLAGAGGGALYNALNKGKNDTKQQSHHKLLNRMLGGAGVGALGANLTGDRIRRYISNKVEPSGYEGKINQIKPKGLKDIWDNAILDKQDASGTTDFMQTRKELLRRAMGVESYDPKTNIWAKQPDNSYSLNPENKNSTEYINNLMLGEGQDSDDTNYDTFLKDPVNYIAKDFNDKSTVGVGPMLGSVTGSSRISAYPFHGGPDGPDYLAKILKRWDVRLKTPEKDALKNYISDRYLHGNQHAQLGDITYYRSIHGDQQTPEQVNKVLQSYLQRTVADSIIYKNSPWINQHMYFKRMPGQDSGYAAIPTTSSGELYPGQSAIKYQNNGGLKFDTDDQVIGGKENYEPVDPRTLLSSTK